MGHFQFMKNKTPYVNLAEVCPIGSYISYRSGARRRVTAYEQCDVVDLCILQCTCGALRVITESGTKWCLDISEFKHFTIEK